MKTIREDKREIVTIWCSEDSAYTVGNFGIEKIIPYAENGQMASVTWFAVYKNGQVAYRLNGALIVGINYQETKNASK